MRTSLGVVVVIPFVSAGTALASILPKNNLHLQDNSRYIANMTEAEFNTIIDDVISKYAPLAELHGATLQVEKLWSNSTVNASAEQKENGKKWIVNMYGGLARRREVTPDGFALVVCHELGHHFAGFSFVRREDWAANEGQSDYFATQACARKIWAEQGELNARFAENINPIAKEKCDAAWTAQPDRDICYRTSSASLSLASLLASLNWNRAPSFEKPDRREVRSTEDSHPRAQCRLDTYLAGSLCGIKFDDNIIPGRNHPDGQGSAGAETLAMQYSCAANTDQGYAARPRCWFKSVAE